MSTLRETCSCGASISVEASYPVDTRTAANKWRTEHKHEFAPMPELPAATDRYNDAMGSHHDAGRTDTGLGFTTPALTTEDDQ